MHEVEVIEAMAHAGHMFHVLRVSFASLLFVVGCVASPGEATDRDAPDEAGATSQAIDEAAPVGDLRLQPETCLPRICEEQSDCTCFNTQCVNNVCRTVLN